MDYSLLFIVLAVYNFYIKFTEGDFNIVWLILLIGLVIYWGIATYLKYKTNQRLACQKFKWFIHYLKYILHFRILKCFNKFYNTFSNTSPSPRQLVRVLIPKRPLKPELTYVNHIH